MRLSHDNPEEYTTIYMDECSVYRRPLLGQLWFPFAQKPKVFGGFQPNKAGRIIGGVNAVTGEISYRIVKRTTVKELIKFFNLQPKLYPHAKKIFIILDNWPVHFNKKVLDAKDKYPKVEFVPLPTYSPWLNKIERLWLFIKKTISYMHPYGDKLPEHMKALEIVLKKLTNEKEFIKQYLGLRNE